MATEKSPGTIRPARGGGSGFVQRSGKYLGEVRSELKKTTWPTKDELIAQTKVVLGLLVLIGVFIALWDVVLGQIVNLILLAMGVERRH